MSISKLAGFYGFTRMPFGRDLAPGMLHRHAGHGEAAARITWAVTEKALGVVTGEVGVGKTVAARAALAALDPARHLTIYIGNPAVGTRGICHAILTAAGLSDTLFSDDATALIHQTGRGYPRAVNNLAIQALLAAFAAGKAIVDESSARAAVTEVTTE